MMDVGSAVRAAQPWQSSRVSDMPPSSGGRDSRLEQLMSSSTEMPGQARQTIAVIIIATSASPAAGCAVLILDVKRSTYMHYHLSSQLAHLSTA